MPISLRLQSMVDALPLRPGMRVLEIGCGPGVASRAVAMIVASSDSRGYVLGIDRSAKAISQAVSASNDVIAEGGLAFRYVAIEAFELAPDEPPFDLIFAVRVGALDGRHPEAGRLAMQRIAQALTKRGRLFVDGVERAVDR